MKASDTQVAGDHYKRLSPEPWEVMEGWNREHFKGFLRYSALKRLGRWDSKDNALQDVRKAIHELTRLEELLEEDAGAAYMEESQKLDMNRKEVPGTLDFDTIKKAQETLRRYTRPEKPLDMHPAAKATMPTEPEVEHIDKLDEGRTRRFAPITIPDHLG